MPGGRQAANGIEKSGKVLGKIFADFEKGWEKVLKTFLASFYLMAYIN